MAEKLVFERPDGKAILTALATDTLSDKYRVGSIAYLDNGSEKTYYGATAGWKSSGSGGSAHVKPDNYSPDYESVAAGTAAQIMGTTGAAGDTITGLQYQVTNAASEGRVEIFDGGISTGIRTLNVVAIGDYYMDINLTSKNGAFTVTTNANVSAVVTGSFT